MPKHMSIPKILEKLNAGTLTRDEAIDRAIPVLDVLLAFQLIPVVGEVIEEVSDLLLLPMATALVDGYLKARAKALAKKAAKAK